MDKSLLTRIVGKIGMAILVIVLADLFFLNWWVVNNQNPKKEIKPETAQEVTKRSESTDKPTDVPSPAPQSSPIVKTIEKTIVETQTKTVVQNANKEIFISMGSGSTNSQNFSDILGTDVTIDTSKYAEIDSVVFEASIWVVGGNGKAWAQIKNVSDSNPLIESQISSSKEAAEVKTSAKIPIAYGSKTYRIQAKTDISEFAAKIENARLKITLK